MEERKLLIIDANNCLANNYFGIKKDVIKKHVDEGIPLRTHVMTTFIRWINMIKKYSYDNVIAVFDTKEKPTFRKVFYPKYKITSEQKPLLEESLKPTKDILRNLGIEIIAVPEYEADDVIASLANDYEKYRYKIDIWTNDKDLYQLVDEQINIVKYDKESRELKRIDAEAVYSEHNLNPKQLLEFKYLYGDRSNNIPGLPSLFWPEKIKELLLKYHNIEKIMSIESNDYETKEIIKSIKINKEILNRNKYLIKLVANIDLKKYRKIPTLSFKNPIGKLYALCMQNMFDKSTTQFLLNFLKKKYNFSI